MVCAHVAHDCHVGNNVIFANNTLLAGHVVVEDRAFLSGAVGVHQFCRIGRLAMIGGHARVVQDVPPYLMIDGISGCIVGLNLVGLRRNGFVAEEIAELKAAYRLIYRSGLKWSESCSNCESIIRPARRRNFMAFVAGQARFRARAPDAADRHPQAAPRRRRRAVRGRSETRGRLTRRCRFRGRRP